MNSDFTSHAPINSLWQRAWMFSFVIHLLTTVLLAVTASRFQGAAAKAVDSGGIVLRLAADDSKPEVGENTIVASVAAEPSAVMQPIEAQPLEPVKIETPIEIPRAPSVLSGDLAAAEQRMHARPDSGVGQARAGRGIRPGAIGAASRASVSVFGVTGTGTKFVYLFDRSASMEGALLMAAKRQLLKSLESLDSIHQFQIIFFNSLPHPIDIAGTGRMAFATEQNKRLATNVVGGVTADLGTDRYTALKKAISFSPDVIFFLTDADDEMSPSELAEIERANNRIGATICVIEFGRPAAPSRENFLMRLARMSGGQYGYVSTMTLSR
jgi:hypothetical protein